MSLQVIQARTPPFSSTLAERVMRKATSGIDRGQLIVRLPSGQKLVIGGNATGRSVAEPQVHLDVHDWKFFWRLLARWDVGFAESYMEGEWSSPDLAQLLKFLCQGAALGAPSRVQRLLRSLLTLRHALNRNTRSGSRRNIAAHYDLGNEFYARWLDGGLSYSSALYGSDANSLEQAQQAKQDRILQLLEIGGSERVLEIGCGWGGLAEQIMRHPAKSLTGLTLSAAQLEFARKRLKGFVEDKQCDLRLEDYRDTKGSFDRVVSIEMLEAVGEAYWPTYFAKLHDLLSPGGISVLQVITIKEERFETYRQHPDFIQRYIFPGGMLPTVEIVEKEIVRAGLKLVSTGFFGDSYARTLSEWRIRFLSAWPEIQKLGFDLRFKRMWNYYLAYCQAGFEIGALDVGLHKISRAV